MPLVACGECKGCKGNSWCCNLTRVIPKTYADLQPCSDGNCVLRKPTGMHTNGVCHCLREPGKAALDWPDGLLREQRAVIACMRDEIARLKGGA